MKIGGRPGQVVTTVVVLGLLAAALPPVSHAQGTARPLDPAALAERLDALAGFGGDEGERRGLLETLRVDAAGSVPLLLEIAEHGRLPAARAAVEVLGAIGDSGATEALARLLEQGRTPQLQEATAAYGAGEVAEIYALRHAAAGALAAIGGREAAAALAQLVSDGDTYPQLVLRGTAVVDGEGNPQDPADQQRQTQRLVSSAAVALAGMVEGGGAETFRAALTRGNAVARNAAALGLARLSRLPEARELLLPLLAEGELDGDAAAEALALLARELPTESLLDSVLPFLEQRECAPLVFRLRLLAAGTETVASRPPLAASAALRERLADILVTPCHEAAALASIVVHRLGQTQRLERALAEGDVRFVAERFVYYVMRGGEESERLLVLALAEHGTAAMSDLFAVCGNEELRRSAETWREDPRNSARGDAAPSVSGAAVFWGTLEGDAAQP